MILQWLDRTEEVLAKFFLAATAVLVFIGAGFRTVGEPLIWSVNLAQLSFVWACVLGADQAWRRNEHIEIDIVVRYFPAQVRHVLAVTWLVVIAVFLGGLVYYGARLTALNVERIMGDTEISYAFVTASMPAGAALMLVTTMRKLKRAVLDGDLSALSGKDGTVL